MRSPAAEDADSHKSGLRIASGFVLQSDASLRRMLNAISPAFSIKKNTAAVFFAAAANTKEETCKKQHVSIIKRGSTEKYNNLVVF